MLGNELLGGLLDCVYLVEHVSGCFCKVETWCVWNKRGCLSNSNPQRWHNTSHVLGDDSQVSAPYFSCLLPCLLLSALLHLVVEQIPNPLSSAASCCGADPQNSSSSPASCYGADPKPSQLCCVLLWSRSPKPSQLCCTLMWSRSPKSHPCWAAPWDTSQLTSDRFEAVLLISDPLLPINDGI